MTRNPFVNALAAALYIVVVASVMYYGLRAIDTSETVVIPIAMLSLFTLSAAVMGYIFFYVPVQLYLDGDKKVATDLFLRTLGAFAALTALIFFLLFSGILS